MANVDQVAHWTGAGGELWVREQERMDAQFVPLLQPVLDAAQIDDRGTVLDVGCGCGALSLAAAAEGAARQVVGVDISEAMLERARERAAHAGLADRVAFVCGDAQVMEPVGPPADAVISRLGVMFFDDPVAAFLALRRASKPGGRLAFACWAPLAENPWYQLPREVAAGHVGPLPAPPAGSPGPFAFEDPERITAVLTAAGWHGVEITALTGQIRIGGGLGPPAAAVFVRQQRSVRSMLEGCPEPVVARVISDLERAFERYLVDGLVAPPFASWVVSALR